MRKNIVVVATDAMMNIKGVALNEKRPLMIFRDGRMNTMPLGMARLYKERGCIKADIVWMWRTMREDDLQRYPALMGRFAKSDTSGFVTGGVVLGFGIFTAKNVDENVGTISEQTGLEALPMEINGTKR